MLTWGYHAIVVLPLLPSGDRAATERLAREPPAGASEGTPSTGAARGYLLLGSRESGVFDDAEMRLLREFSRGISLALEGVECAN
jgi:hypothetical protein